ncbi:hypothetical protein GOM49_00720 [Clostridium bovifaecis]|uniref:Uncharacterized protein n=1 Tax=Clostridium bovifaecis TaxID=2184719 RepID=A0A6I6EJ53_9CLOT|nr:hypothetical protein GOM49_00720 [Clostridium bovifaecis]
MNKVLAYTLIGLIPKSELANKIISSAEKLNLLSNKLKEMVGRFKI